MEDLRNYINSVRYDFMQGKLVAEEAPEDPYELFEKWFEEAVQAQVLDPYAMALGTVSKEGMPSVRVVYLRDISETGLVFYTNYQSEKGQHLEAHPMAAANFFWVELERQIRFNGLIEKVSAEKSDAYFASRPRESQLGAWASHQSEVLQDREELMKRYSQYELEFKDKEVPRPPYWGGYRLRPVKIEFWQGRPSRLHDRVLYHLDDDAHWQRERLSP